MVFAVGLSHYSIAFFHLSNHALFKVLLFLSAGCVIHGISDEQNMLKMGGLIKSFPISYTMILIGSLALVGFSFLTGFYSKDAILEIAIAKGNFVGNFAHFLGCSAAFCTSFYSFRLVFLTFVNKTNIFKSYVPGIHEAPIKMVFPLMVLSLGAIFVGFLSRDMFIGLGNSFFGNCNTINVSNYNLIDCITITKEGIT
jgi:NADH-ubiquinone oxidoreductase chain 5